MESHSWFVVSANIWTSVLIAVIAFALCMALKRKANSYSRRNDISLEKKVKSKGVFSIAGYAVLVFAVISVLQINGVNVSTLIAGMGIVGIAVGFAVQDILKDLIMGVTLAWEGFYSFGDAVQYKNITGVVVSFNLKATKILESETGNIYTICNRNISEIKKLSECLDVVIPFPYGEEAERSRNICREICNRAKQIENVKECDFLGTDEFAASSVNYRIRLQVSPIQMPKTKRACLGIIQDVFAENKISVPYPQLDVHIKQ